MTRLIVCGAPLSGTSIVGGALARAGVHLGDSAGTAIRTDVIGSFVNRAAEVLHDELLSLNGVDWREPSGALRVADEHREAARALVAAEFGDRTDWALIAPLAVLFTDLWRDVVPDARWVFVVRRPADWAWATVRRQSGTPREATPAGRLASALRTWNAWTGRIIDYCSRNADRASVFMVPEDCEHGGRTISGQLPADPPDRTAVAPGDVFREELIGTDPPAWVRWQARWQSGVSETLAALQRLRRPASHDGNAMPLEAPPARDRRKGTERVLCIACRRRHRVSETFVRDHALRLPGMVRWLAGRPGHFKYDKNSRPVGSIGERSLFAALSEFGIDARPLLTRALARYLRRMRVDVVLAEYGVIAVDYVDACRLTGIPLVAHFHGFDAYKRSTVAENLDGYRRLFEVARVLVAVSRDMVEQLVSLGAPRERIVWNPCGVDTAFFGGATPAMAPPLFLSVGRFVEKKAPQNVLMAFHHLVQRRPDARLLMVGEGIMRDPCRQLATALGLGDHVTFAGARSPIEIARYHRTARAFVQHSVRDGEGNAEGTPVSVLEAGASGLPVVATRHMGIADVVVEGETGLLVDEGDIRAMGEHLVTLYDDPVLAGALGARARERICAEFSMERSIERLTAALEAAIAGGRA